jgi:glycosyltransferase involved in cell wall biosynthesis
MPMTAVFASVLLLTYNQQNFVQEALQSLLDQDYDNLEIVVSDDSSRDGTWQLISETAKQYCGPKRIILNRNAKNLGVVGNYFKAFSLSSGEVLFTGAGDDASLPSRCLESIQLWCQYDKKPDLIAADGYDMLFDGRIVGIKTTDDLQNWNAMMWCQRRPFIFGASHMMTRRLLALRDLNASLPVEDQNLIIRALMMGGAMRLAKPLVKHRRGGISQAQRFWTYEEKKFQLIKSAQEALLESDEILLDASCLGLDMEQAVKPAQQLNTCALHVLQAQSTPQMLRAVLRFNQVPWKKRIKFLSFSAMPTWHAAALSLKRIFRTRKI